MHTPGQVDRRKYQRVRTDDVLSVHRVGVRPELGHGVDLGLGGVRFQLSGSNLCIGEVVEVTFNLGGGIGVATGRVIRTTEISPLAQEIAVEFLEVGDETIACLEELGVIPGTEEPEG